MAEFPSMPLWTDALIGDTFHLTPAQFGAYMRLLIVAWRRPYCDLPNDDGFLGRCIGDPKNWHRLKPILMNKPFFELREDGFYRQFRLLREREYVSRKAVRSSAGGRGKSLKRLGRDAAKRLLNECSNPATTPTPIYKKEASAKNGFLAEPDTEEFVAWKTYAANGHPALAHEIGIKESAGLPFDFISQWPPDDGKY